MGHEASCRVELDGVAADAKVLLETEELIIRGRPSVRVPFREAIDITATDGVLALRWGNRSLRVHLGRDAAKWAEKIRNPKSVTEKLGLKAGQKISIVGHLDGSFVGALDVSTRLRKPSDVIFLVANHRDDLGKLTTLREYLAPAGAIWIIRPKGSADISEAEVLAAGKAAGLVDVKVVKYSETHTAEKLVIPLASR